MAEENKQEETPGNNRSNSNHTLKTVLIVIGVLLVLCGLATAAKFTFVGHDKNLRTGRFAMMQERDRDFGREFGRNCSNQDGFLVGISGQIIAVNTDRITVKTSDKDQIVNIATDTSIIKNRQVAAKGDLKVSDEVTVRGSSNSAGEITATLIRVQPR